MLKIIDSLELGVGIDPALIHQPQMKQPAFRKCVFQTVLPFFYFANERFAFIWATLGIQFVCHAQEGNKVCRESNINAIQDPSTSRKFHINYDFCGGKPFESWGLSYKKVRFKRNLH